MVSIKFQMTGSGITCASGHACKGLILIALTDVGNMYNTGGTIPWMGVLNLSHGEKELRSSFHTVFSAS